MSHPRSLSADELRRYLASHSEQDYLLVDVREPAEYRQGHLPGARLIPLLELEDMAAELPVTARKILYCHSGSRSLRAAAFLTLTHGVPEVFSLTGGLAAWHGTVLHAPPRLEIFAGKGAPAQLVLQAMDLEKGARRFYLSLQRQLDLTVVRSTADLLAEAELHHSRRLYELLGNVSRSAPPPFDVLYGGLLGTVAESGMPLRALVSRVASAGPAGAAALLELGVEMEYRALDLYRTLAHDAALDVMQDCFVELADGEKHHIRLLLRALGDLAADHS